MERSRHLRVAAELMHVVNDLLETEIKDPRLHGVRVSGVEVSGDLGVAKLFYGTLEPDADCAPVDAAFAKASGFLRGRVGRELKLRRAPELRFLHDTSARQGIEIGRLLAGGAAEPPDTSGE